MYVGYVRIVYFRYSTYPKTPFKKATQDVVYQNSNRIVTDCNYPFTIYILLQSIHGRISEYYQDIWYQPIYKISTITKYLQSAK